MSKDGTSDQWSEDGEISVKIRIQGPLMTIVTQDGLSETYRKAT